MRNRMGAIAHVDQRIVGGLDPIGELARQEQQSILGLGAVCHRLVDRQHTEFDDLAVRRPWPGWIFRLIAGTGELRLQAGRRRRTFTGRTATFA
jgi:hypothetical protein